MPEADRLPILVTGATGRQGGTGRAVVEHLRARGLPVRAMAHRIDERLVALEAAGAEVVLGDYGDHRSLLAALDGVGSAYFCHPVGAGIAEAAGLFAAAARAQGVRRIVDLSLGSTSPDGGSPQLRAQWVAEQIFEWAGLDGVHLRVAAFFMENLLLIDAPFARRDGRIANAFGGSMLSWISGSDVGAMAAALLADPGLTKERIVTVGGAEHMNYPAIAKEVSAVTRRSIAYSELSPSDWHAVLVRAAEAAGHPNPRGADHLVAQAAMVRLRGVLPVSDHIIRFTGRPPVTMSEFLELHAEHFR